MQESNKEKKWGGHNKGVAAASSKGHGPAFEVRAALNLSQSAFAALLFVTKTTVAAWEREGTRPRIGSATDAIFVKLAAKAGVDLSEGE